MADELKVLAPLEEDGADGLKTLSAQEWAPGEDASVPINEQHPEMGMIGRFNLKTYADAGPRTMIENLRRAGFEAKPRGEYMRFSIRRPGGKWYVLDPTGWSPWEGAKKFFTGDFSRGARQMLEPLSDVVDPINAYGMTGAGMTVGALASPFLGPAAPAGPGIGAGAMEALKGELGEYYGYYLDPEERRHKIGFETVAGMGGEVGAQLLNKLAIRVGYGAPGVAREVARRGTELTRQQAQLLKGMRRSRDVRTPQYAAGAGETPPPPQATIEEVMEELAAKGGMTPDELAREKDLLAAKPQSLTRQVGEAAGIKMPPEELLPSQLPDTKALRGALGEDVPEEVLQALQRDAGEYIHHGRKPADMSEEQFAQFSQLVDELVSHGERPAGAAEISAATKPAAAPAAAPVVKAGGEPPGPLVALQSDQTLPQEFREQVDKLIQAGPQQAQGNIDILGGMLAQYERQGALSAGEARGYARRLREAVDQWATPELAEPNLRKAGKDYVVEQGGRTLYAGPEKDVAERTFQEAWNRQRPIQGGAPRPGARVGASELSGVRPAVRMEIDQIEERILQGKLDIDTMGMILGLNRGKANYDELDELLVRVSRAAKTAEENRVISDMDKGQFYQWIDNFKLGRRFTEARMARDRANAQAGKPIPEAVHYEVGQVRATEYRPNEVTVKLRDQEIGKFPSHRMPQIREFSDLVSDSSDYGTVLPDDYDEMLSLLDEFGLDRHGAEDALSRLRTTLHKQQEGTGHGTGLKVEESYIGGGYNLNVEGEDLGDFKADEGHWLSDLFKTLHAAFRRGQITDRQIGDATDIWSRVGYDEDDIDSFLTAVDWYVERAPKVTSRLLPGNNYREVGLHGTVITHIPTIDPTGKRTLWKHAYELEDLLREVVDAGKISPEQRERFVEVFKRIIADGGKVYLPDERNLESVLPRIEKLLVPPGGRNLPPIYGGAPRPGARAKAEEVAKQTSGMTDAEWQALSLEERMAIVNRELDKLPFETIGPGYRGGPMPEASKLHPISTEDAIRFLDENAPRGARVVATIRKKDGSLRSMELSQPTRTASRPEIAASAKDLTEEDLRDMVRELGREKPPKPVADQYPGLGVDELPREGLLDWLQESQPAHVSGRGRPGKRPPAVWERVGEYSGPPKPGEVPPMALPGTSEYGRWRTPGEVVQLEIEVPGEGIKRYGFDYEGKPFLREGEAEPFAYEPPYIPRRTAIGAAEPGRYGGRKRQPKPKPQEGPQDPLRAAAELKAQTTGAAGELTGEPSGAIPGPPSGLLGPPASGRGRHLGPGTPPGGPPGGPPGPPPAGPAGAPRTPQGRLQAAVGLARDVAGLPLKVAGGAMEFPARATKRGIEKGYEVAGMSRAHRRMAHGWQKDVVKTLRELMSRIRSSSGASPNLQQIAEETLDLTGRPFLRNEEVRDIVEMLRHPQAVQDLEDWVIHHGGTADADFFQALLESAKGGLPEGPKVGSRIFGFSPTTAPEAALGLSVATGGGAGTAVSTLGAIGGLGIAGKGVRNLGLAIMRDPSGDTLRRVIMNAPASVQQKLGPVLRKIGRPSSMKAALYVAMHDPEVREYMRSISGEEQPDESTRRVPATAAGR